MTMENPENADKACKFEGINTFILLSAYIVNRIM
jgi:hypothetical protein